MSEWREVKIGDIAEKIAMGPFGSNIKVETFVDSGVPVISGSHLRESRLRDGEYNFVTEDHAERMRNSIVFRGDVIFTHAGNISNLSYIPESSLYDRYVISQRQFYLRCNLTRADPCFITYFFHSPSGRHKLLANSSQVGVPSIAQPSSYLKSISILLPPLHEQKAIAHILSTLDDKIDQLRKTNSVLEDMASALFKSWFVDFDPVKAKQENRPTGLTKDLDDLFPDSFEDSALGPIPKGWRVGRIDAFTDVFIGKTPPRKESHWFTENSTDMRWISIRDLGRSSTYVIESSEYLTYEAVEKFRVRRIPDNTVVLSFKMTVGRVAITVGEMTSNEAIAHFNIKDSVVISPEYLYCYLAQYDYSQLGSTSSIATAVNSDSIRSINVLVPDEQPMTIFMGQTKHLFNRVMSNIQQIRTLTNLRDTLLPKLISGDLRVPEAEQMVAELGL